MSAITTKYLLKLWGIFSSAKKIGDIFFILGANKTENWNCLLEMLALNLKNTSTILAKWKHSNIRTKN